VGIEQAVIGAQAELAKMGEDGLVIDVQRTGMARADIILGDGRIISVEARVAIKLLKLLRSRHRFAWRPPS
jgi:hypothetical protein